MSSTYNRPARTTSGASTAGAVDDLASTAQDKFNETVEQAQHLAQE